MFIFSGGSVCLELFQGCTPVTLLLLPIFVYVSKLSAEECLGSYSYADSFISVLYLFYFSTTLRSTKRDRIKLHRLVESMGIEGESALVMGWRGTSPWGSCHGKSCRKCGGSGLQNGYGINYKEPFYLVLKWVSIQNYGN